MGETESIEETGKVNKYSVGNLAYVQFEEGNNICFGQDFGLHIPLPSGVKFYPREESNGCIWFIGDGYGIINDNKLKEYDYGLSGRYGNGAINVSVKDLPIELVDYCRNNFLKKINNHKDGKFIRENS